MARWWTLAGGTRLFAELFLRMDKNDLLNQNIFLRLCWGLDCWRKLAFGLLIVAVLSAKSSRVSGAAVLLPLP
jgi:hypothetical protein